MLSNYEDISKMLKAYIEESLTKIAGDVSILRDKIKEDYKFELSTKDITDLGNAISIAKQARSDYNSALQNSQFATADWSDALEKQKTLAGIKEGDARQFAYTLAKKVCIGTYKGPLTIDTMKELKEQGYDGTYGSTTMMQMYSLYNKNQNLVEAQKNYEDTVAKQADQLVQYEQSFRGQYIRIENLTNENNTLKLENENSKKANQALLDRLNSQTESITMLEGRIDDLSKKWSTQLVETFKGILGKEVSVQPQNNISSFPIQETSDQQKIA